METKNMNETTETTKAQRILRCKLPALTACGLAFEKRTGSVFTAVVTPLLDEDGKQVTGADGKPATRLQRLVVNDVDSHVAGCATRMAEAGVTATDVAEAIEAKRAAAIVDATTDEVIAKHVLTAVEDVSQHVAALAPDHAASEALAERVRAVDVAITSLLTAAATLGLERYNAIVDAYELPVAAERVAGFKTQLEAANAANASLMEKLEAMKAAGIDLSAFGL